MKLWLFEREKDYDTYWAALIRAETEEAARIILLTTPLENPRDSYSEKEYFILDNPANPWLCREVILEDKAGIVHLAWFGG